MGLMQAPVPWLHELAKEEIRTQWGEMMKTENPAETVSQKVYKRLEPKYGHKVAYAFDLAAPLLAERLAIAEYKKKNPRIEPVAPEVLSYQEALETIMPEVGTLTMDERRQVLTLLKTDETMQNLKKDK